MKRSKLHLHTFLQNKFKLSQDYFIMKFIIRSFCFFFFIAIQTSKSEHYNFNEELESNSIQLYLDDTNHNNGFLNSEIK